MMNIYRHGLKLRYGPKMQVIAGNHCNLSFKIKFWKFFYKKCNSSIPLQHFISDHYMRIARNFLRINPLITYLFGATPAVDKSSLKHVGKELKKLDKDTYYLPYGTSLRLSSFGYRSSLRKVRLGINYNSLAGYTRSLDKVMKTPSPEYEKLGIFKDGIYQQLNTNLLQVDNEDYGLVRPKRKTPSSVMSIYPLEQRGASYLEIRSLDVDPFSPTGVGLDQLRFLELILIACLFEFSPIFDNNQLDIILANHERISLWGRQKGLKLIQLDGGKINFKTWALNFLNKIGDLALLLDQAEGTSVFVQVLEKQIEKVKNPDLTPSGKILQMMRSNHQSFLDFHLQLAHHHKESFGKKTLSNAFITRMNRLATESIEKQHRLEANHEKSFEEFLDNYFNPK